MTPGRNYITMPEDTDIKLIEEALNSLGEHFDTVQIFTTRHVPYTEGGTRSAALGVGNWYARYGQVAEWLVKTDEHTRREVRRYEEGE